MVHTADLLLNFTEEDVSFIQDRYGLTRKMQLEDMGLQYNGISVTILYDERRVRRDIGYTQWFADIHLNFIDLLSKPNISQNDVPEILRLLNDCLSRICYARTDDLILRRIDYRYDVVIKDEKKRNVILKMLAKAADKKAYMKKKKKNPYKSSVYYNSGSKKTIVYDKEKERKDKEMTVQPYEKDVLRFEACLCSRHLYYNCKSKKGIDRLLENYLHDDIYKKYMSAMITGTYYTGDFYKRYHAEKVIKGTSMIRERDKVGIIEFLKAVSQKRSVTKACKLISKYTAERYLLKLQEVGINPILIPKSDGYTHIENPLKEFYSSL